MTKPIQKTRLDNELTVVLREMHHAPVTSFWIWYRVGSRNERPGLTGVSHWVEHMMFRGSPEFPLGSLDRLVSREGGRWNAFTTHDFTAYYETLPADRIGLALRLESDRMINASMNDEDVEAERTVIISERHMYENQPMFLLREELNAAAFRVHPYHHEIIGDETDLETMSRDDLYSHYRDYYNPANAVIVVAGDFEGQAMLAEIERYFGGIPAAKVSRPQIRPEPPLRGERRVTVNGPGDAAYLIYSFRVPEATHEDFYPLVLLDAAYAGGGGIGAFGGGTTNKSSRLYKALVDSDLAAAVAGSMSPSIDPFLYSIYAVARPDRSLAEIETALQDELDRLGDDPLTQDELDKAIKRARAGYVMAGESVTGQAQMIGMAEAVAGDYRWYENTLDALAGVTLEDIERVRREYLRRNNRIVGLYKPEGNSQS